MKKNESIAIKNFTERMLSYGVDCIKADALEKLVSVANLIIHNVALAAAAESIEKIEASGFLPDGVKVVFGKSGLLELVKDNEPEQQEQEQEQEQEQPEQTEQTEQTEQPEQTEQTEQPEQTEQTEQTTKPKFDKKAAMRRVAAERLRHIKDARAKLAAGEQLTDEEREVLRKEEMRKEKVAWSRRNAHNSRLERLAKLAEKVNADDSYDSAVDAELEVRQAYGVDREISDAYEYADAPEVDCE